MSQEPIPETVVRFIEEHIHSVEELEVLLLLFRGRDRWWDAPSVATELWMDPRSAESRLESLSARKLLDARLASAVVFQYAPVAAEVDTIVQGLARVYLERRLAVTSLILGKPVERIRGFAAAFRIRKGENDG